MMTAQEARRIKDINVNKHLENILIKIKKAADDGFDQIQISSCNFYLIKDKLLNLGYNIEYGMLGMIVFISWK